MYDQQTSKKHPRYIQKQIQVQKTMLERERMEVETETPFKSNENCMVWVEYRRN
jgi:hypothetical protein